MPLFWDLIDDSCKVKLCVFQWNKHKTLLDLFVESKKPEIDHIPEEENLADFMREAPHNQVKVN